MLELYRGPERDRVMGWRGSATSAGGIAWPLLSGALGGVSWHASFGVYLIGVPLGLLTLRVLPPVPRASGGQRRERGGALRLLRGHPALLGWYGLFVFSALLTYSLAVFLPQRLAQVGIQAPFLVSVYTTGASLVATAIGLVYARLRARLGYGVLLRAAAGSWLAAFAILGTSGWPPVMFLAPALFGFGQGLLMPALTVLIGDGVPAAQRGRATALSSTCIFAGQFVSPLLFGPLMAATSITAGYLIAAAAAGLLLFVLLAVRVGDPGRPEKDVASMGRCGGLPGGDSGEGREQGDGGQTEERGAVLAGEVVAEGDGQWPEGAGRDGDGVGAAADGAEVGGAEVARVGGGLHRAEQAVGGSQQ